MFYHNSKAFQNTSYWVLHTRNVLEQARQVASLSKDIQWGSRTIFLIGDKNSIKPYQNARNNLQPSITRLSEVTADNTVQQARTRKLQGRKIVVAQKVQHEF